MDGTARRETGVDIGDKNFHLAKVRVAGSNPVFRSIVAGRRHFFQPGQQLTSSSSRGAGRAPTSCTGRELPRRAFVPLKTRRDVSFVPEYILSEAMALELYSCEGR